MKKNNLERIIYRAHTSVRSFDGIHADIALEELLKLCLFLKYSKKINITKTNINNEVDLFFDRLKENKAYLRSTDLKIKLSKNSIFSAINILKDLDFKEYDKDGAGRLIQNIFKPAIRSGLGQYFTPVNIIDLMLRTSFIIKPKRLLDPFSGSSEILRMAKGISKNRIELIGIEKNERLVKVANLSNLIEGIDDIKILHADTFDDSSLEGIKPDLIVTNPPFGVTIVNKKNKKFPIEILALERCMDVLSKNGMLVIVLPDGVLTNKRFESFRSEFSKNNRILSIVSLPEHTFKPFGAAVKSSILFVKKTSPKKTDNIILSSLNKIGYDSNFNQAESEIEELAIKMQKFIRKNYVV